MRNAAIIFFVLVVSVIIYSLVTFTQKPDLHDTIFDTNQQVPALIEPLTQASCLSAGGEWNSCGSACRREPAGTVCIELCVEYCECSSNDQCPSDFACQDFVDGVGVCK